MPKIDFRHTQLEKNSLRSAFGRAAKNYDDWADLQRRVGDNLLCKVNEYSVSLPTILDLGSGTGYCAKRLSEHCDKLIALDIAHGMLAQQRLGGIANVTYICGDAESLPLQTASVDMVFSNLAIQWCQGLENLFAEIKRVLRPGGQFLFSSFGPQTLCELRDAWAEVDRMSHVNEFIPLSLIHEVMHRSGFIEIELKSEKISIDYRDVLQLMRELKGIGAHNVTRRRPRGLTGKKKLDRMMNAYARQMPGSSCIATFELYYGSAYCLV